MSVDASLTVYLQSYDMIQIVDCLIKSGLDIYSPDKKIYMIISEDESYTWDEMKIDRNEFDGIIEERKSLGYPFGVSLWENGDIFTEVLALSDDKLIFSCNINRKAILADDIEITDVNYYIRKIIVPLKKKFPVSGFDYIEWR